MKKIIAVLAASLMLAGAVSAQGLGSLLGGLTGKSGSGSSDLGSILNTVSNVVYSFTGQTNVVSLPGTWTYEGAAIALSGDSAVANIASTAASGTVEKKMDEYLAKVGIKPGTMTFTFNEDLSFVCTIGAIPISGTWKTLDEGARVQLQFGKTLKFLNMTGTLKPSVTGCEMLFDSGRLMEFLKKALAYVAKQNSTASTFASLAENYNDMKLGFKLARK